MNYINIYIKLLFRESLICQSGGATPEWVWGARARAENTIKQPPCVRLGDARATPE